MKVFKKLLIYTLILILSIQLTLPAFAVGEGELTYTNMALNRPVTASSNADKAYFGADGVNVSEYYTYWEADSEDNNPWWQVDLELSYTIDSIEIEPRISRETGSLDYEVWASNDKNFKEYKILCDKEIADTSDGKFISKTRSRKSFRYLRVVKKDNKKDFTIGEFRAIVKKDNIKHGVSQIGGTTQVPVYGKEGSYVIPQDVIGTSFEKPVSLLGALNIMCGYSDGNFMTDEPISRAEMAAISVRMLNMNNLYFGNNPTYNDVPTDHWAYSAIEIATGLGIINGLGDGSFMPDEKITTAQAVKIIVSVLGYGVKAMSNGGYPEGYLSVAYSLGLLKDVESKIDEPVTRGEIAHIVYKALHEDTVVIDSVTANGTMSAHYANFLNQVLGIYREKGQVTETSRTGLTYVDSSVSEGMIKIDDSEYFCLVPDPESFIGLPVEFYYKDIEGNNTVVFMSYDENKKIKTIDSNDITAINTSKLSYIDNNHRKQEVAIEGSKLNVIYNERAKRPGEYSSLSTLIPADGIVTLVDVNGNNKYELLIIKKYETLIVDRVSKDNRKIYFKNSNSAIDIEKVEGNISVVLNNKEQITWDSLMEWDVVSLMKSTDRNGKAIHSLLVSRKQVKGILSMLDSNNYEVEIKGKTYKVLRSFYDSLPDLGSSGTYYLDAMGRIAYFDGREVGEGVYGYLMMSGKTNGSALGSKFAVRIFTQNGSFEEYPCSDKLTVDNKKFESFESIQEHFINSGRIEGQEHQVIKYALNSKGEVLSINTKQEDYGDAGLVRNDESLYLDVVSDGTAYTFKGGVFDCNFSVDPDAVVMKVPDDMSKEKDFEILSTSKFQPETSHVIDAYDGGENRAMKFILFTDSAASTISNNSDIFLVDKVFWARDSEDEFRRIAKGLYMGKEVSYFEADEGVLDGIKQGDILQIALTSSNEIKVLRKLFVENKYDDDGNAVAPGEYMISKEFPEYARTTDSSLVMRNNFYSGYGRVVSRDGSMVNIEYVTNLEDTIREGVKVDASWRATYTYIYDSVENTVSIATEDDIEDALSVGDDNASMAFFFISAVEAKALVILK